MWKEQISCNDVNKYCFQINMIPIVRKDIIQSNMCNYSAFRLGYEMDYMMDYETSGGWPNVFKQEAWLLVEGHFVSHCSSAVQCSQGWKINILMSLMLKPGTIASEKQ